MKAHVTLRSCVVALVLVSCGTSNADQQESARALPGVPTDTTEETAAPTTEPITTEAPAPQDTSTEESSVEESSAPPPEPAATETAVQQEPRSITVGGMGAEYGPPDRAVVDIGVTARGASVDESTRLASSAGAAMVAALEAGGVPAAGIQTSRFGIHPYHAPPDYVTVAGYETTLGYRVTVTSVADLGSVLAEAVRAGGDSVNAWSMRFEGDPDGYMEAARAEAWTDVRARAAATAAEIAEPLGEVLDVHEKVLMTSPQGMWQGGEGDSAPFDIPISPGVVGVIVLLTVTYAIGA